MKQIYLGLAVLVLCLLAVVLYWTTLPVTEPTRATSPSERAAVAAPNESVLAAPAAVGVPALEPAPEVGATSAMPPADTTGARDPARSEATPLDWIGGVVQVPEGTPADEQMEVVAFLATARAEELARRASDAELAANGDLLARAPVARDGSFRIQVPTHRGPVELALRARYLRGAAAAVVAWDEPRATEIRIAAELGAWVTGRVTLPADATPEERDVADLEIQLALDPLRSLDVMTRVGRAPEEVSTRCSAELGFEFRGVQPGFQHIARASPARLAACKSASFMTEAGRRYAADLALSRGGSVSGHVRGTDGDPVAGADVSAWIDPVAFGQGGLRVRDAKADADGSFTLAHLPAGTVHLRVERDGFIDAKQEVEVAEGQSLAGVEIALGRGNSIAGRVTWPDGAPVEGVEVDVTFDLSQLAGLGAFNAMQGAEGEADTDAGGRFEVTGLGKGPFTVAAAAEPRDAGSGESKSKWRARADGVAPGTANLELVLEPPLSIAGRVVDATGAPIAKFEVKARSVGAGMFSKLGAEVVAAEFSDGAGEFALSGLRPAKWEVTAHAEGFAPSAPAAIELPRDVATPVTIELQRASAVAGVVLDATGAPAVGAQVTLKLELNDILAQVGDDSAAPPKATSDEQGRFELTGLVPGDHSLVAKHTDAAPSEPVALVVEPGARTEGVVLRLRTGGTLTGDVYDKEGELAAGATVIAQNPTDYTTQRFATCDASGRFRMEHVAPGSWQVINLRFDQMGEPAADDGAQLLSALSDMRMATATIVDGEATHVVLGAPPKNPVEVRGRVVLGDRGVPGVFVSFLADGRPGLEHMRFVTTDGDGAYSLQLNEPGGFLVTVQKVAGAGEQQSVSGFVTVPEVERFEHDIALPVGGIAGTVTLADGAPASRVRVSLSIEGPLPNASLIGEQYAEISTDEAGRYELVWLKPGTYTVSVGGAALGGMFGADSGVAARQLRSGLVIESGDWLRGVDFRLSGPGAIAGTVVDSAGQPVAGATIFARDAGGQPLERLSMVQSDSSGRFRYSGIGEGRYTLIARTATDVSSAPASVEVRPGATSDVALSVAPGTILIVSLSDRDGNPIQARFSVLDEAGHQVNGVMSLTDVMEAMQKGTFTSREQRVGPLPPGKYRVTASTDSGVSVNKPVTLSGQAERRLNLRL